MAWLPAPVTPGNHLLLIENQPDDESIKGTCRTGSASPDGSIQIRMSSCAPQPFIPFLLRDVAVEKSSFPKPKPNSDHETQFNLITAFGTNSILNLCSVQFGPSENVARSKNAPLRRSK